MSGARTDRTAFSQLVDRLDQQQHHEREDAADLDALRSVICSPPTPGSRSSANRRLPSRLRVAAPDARSRRRARPARARPSPRRSSTPPLDTFFPLETRHPDRRGTVHQIVSYRATTSGKVHSSGRPLSRDTLADDYHRPGGHVARRRRKIRRVWHRCRGDVAWRAVRRVTTTAPPLRRHDRGRVGTCRRAPRPARARCHGRHDQDRRDLRRHRSR